MCCIINYNWIQLELFLWFHILASNYIIIFPGFVLKWIFLSSLQRAQGVNNNPVIKGGCSSNLSSILGHIVELFRTHCHGLDVPELESEKEHNWLIRLCNRGGSFLLSSLWINKFSLFTKVTSFLHFIPLCCIFLIPFISIFIFLVILHSHHHQFLTRLFCHNFFDTIYALFCIMGCFSLILSISYFQMEYW